MLSSISRRGRLQLDNKLKAPIPEPIVQLQRQLDQFRSTRPRRTKLPESLWRVLPASLCVSPPESRFLLGQEAADGGSADFELAGDLGFAAALLVQFSGFDGFVNHRWRAAELFALLPGMS